MANINEFIFSKASATEKLETIKSISDSEILRTSLSTLTRICKECGKDGVFFIENDRRVGNDWNSLVDGLEYTNKLFVKVYYQNTSTDTDTFEYADEFFSSGKFYGETHIGSYVYYPEDKANVLRSILSEYVYQKYIEKDERERKAMTEKILHYSIVNPIYNEFYKELGPRHICLDWNSNNREKYNNGKKAVNQYAYDHVYELVSKSKEELQDIYRKVFATA